MNGKGPATSLWLSERTRFCGPTSSTVTLVFYRDREREGGETGVATFSMHRLQSVFWYIHTNTHNQASIVG